MSQQLSPVLPTSMTAEEDDQGPYMKQVLRVYAEDLVYLQKYLQKQVPHSCRLKVLVS